MNALIKVTYEAVPSTFRSEEQRILDMADVDTKLARANTANDWVVLEIREGKQEQQTNESEAIPSAPPPLISEEQRSWTAVAEPPDIDLRHVLAFDQDQIEKLLDPANFDSDFTSRIMKYHFVDHGLEVDLLDKYLEWIEEIQKVASESGNPRAAKHDRQLKFYKKLYYAVVEDSKENDRAVDLAEKDVSVWMKQHGENPHYYWWRTPQQQVSVVIQKMVDRKLAKRRPIPQSKIAS